MGETSDLSPLPIPSDGVHRILGQRLGPDSFTELGWIVLRNDAPMDPVLPRVEADFVLADPRQGIVLVQVAQGAQPPAADQLRQRLDSIGFAEAMPGFLPIVMVQLNHGDVWRLTGLLDFALAAEAPIEVQGDWVALVQQALLAKPAAPSPASAEAASVPVASVPVAGVPVPAGALAGAPMPAGTVPAGAAPRAALPLPEERQPLAPPSRPHRPRRSRRLHMFWAVALLVTGAALGVLNYLGPPREPAGPPDAPPALQARVEQAPPPAPEPPPAAAPREAPAAAAPPAPADPSAPAPRPDRQVEEAAAADALPLPPPPAPAPTPARQAALARIPAELPWRDAPEAPARPEPQRPESQRLESQRPEPQRPEPPRPAPEQGWGAEPQLPPGWYVAKPPEADRDWSTGTDALGPEPAAAIVPPRIFVHHHRSRRDLAESVAGRAFRLGGTVETRVVPATPPTPEIRYFNAADRAAAERLAETLGGGYRTRSFLNFSPRPRLGTIEVWVPGRSDDWD